MANLSLGFWAVVVLLIGSLIDASDASIHTDESGGFVKIGNATSYLHGGTEALDASKFENGNVSGNSSIRFELPVEMVVHLKNFYGKMSLAYLVLGLGWFLEFAQYSRNRIHLHYHISMVIFLGMFEMVSRFLELRHLDSTGKNHKGFAFWTITFYSLKNALTRLLLLVISTGYGVVKYRTNGTTSRMLLFFVMYAATIENLGLVEKFENIISISKIRMIYLLVSKGILECYFILWIWWSLLKTLNELKVKSNGDKLQIYKKFANGLMISAFLSSLWVMVEIYFGHSENELWLVRWILPVFWHILAFFVMVLVCLLWPPLNDSARYLYVAEVEENGHRD